MNTTLGGLWSLGIKTRERGEGKGEAEGEGRRGSGMHVCLSVRPSVCMFRVRTYLPSIESSRGEAASSPGRGRYEE